MKTVAGTLSKFKGPRSSASAMATGSVSLSLSMATRT